MDSTIPAIGSPSPSFGSIIGSPSKEHFIMTLSTSVLYTHMLCIIFSPDNPLLLNIGSAVELLHPTMSVMVGGLIAEYRVGGNQIIAVSELSAYYMYSTRVAASNVMLNDSLTRQYIFEFGEALPLLLVPLDLVVELDVTNTLPGSDIRTVSIPIGSS